MSERYTKLFSLAENLYAEGAPIVVKAGALLKDNESNWLIAQLKLHNISDKPIKFAKVELTLLDSLNRNIETPVTFEYLDLSAERGTDFGAKTPIKISESTTRGYTVRVLEVGFSDNSVWHDNNNEWEQMPSQTSISSVLEDSTAITGYKSIFGASANMELCEHKDLWICACGKINHNDEEKCYHCNASHEELKNTSIETLVLEYNYSSAVKKAESSKKIDEINQAIEELEKIKEYKDAESLITTYKEKIEEIKNATSIKADKQKKVIKLSAIISGGVILLGLLGYFALYPLISFWCGNYSVYINMYGITEFEIPNGTKRINDDAFYNCDRLTSVVIPDSVTSIGDTAFYYCDSLTSVVIPDSVTTIGNGAFCGCHNLSNVVIPDSVTTIGNGAFTWCSSLTNVVIGNSVTYIGDAAFSWCSSLTSVVIPNSVTSIGNDAFSSCDSLTRVVIPDSVTSIGKRAFYDCDRLASVVIGNSVTSIGEQAFFWCSSLTSVVIGDSVTHIGEEAFWMCHKLAEVINFSSLNVTAGNSKYGNVGYYALEVHKGASKIDNIGDYLFYTLEGTNYLISYVGNDTELTLPESYKGEQYVINKDAFYNCDSLTNVVIGDSVTSIGDWAFYGCDSLTSVVIPNSVNSIGKSAFSNCDKLTDVYYTGSAAEWAKISIGSDNSNLKNATIHYNYVPEE